MPSKEPLKPFGKATLKELVEESRRLREQAEELRKRMADLAQVIDERTRSRAGPDAPPTH
jgi:hypothetical protein